MSDMMEVCSSSLLYAEAGIIQTEAVFVEDIKKGKISHQQY